MTITTQSLEKQFDTPNDTQVTPQDFVQGMRRFASGVSLIASHLEGEPVGLAATAVNSVSAEPPSLLICVNQSASAHDGIATSGRFSVNLLAAEDGYLLDVFGSSSRRAERFLADAWDATPEGVPVLNTAMVAFVCQVTEEIKAGTHTIFIGRITQMRVADDESSPLIYLDRKTRSLVPESV